MVGAKKHVERCLKKHFFPSSNKGHQGAMRTQEGCWGMTIILGKMVVSRSMPGDYDGIGTHIEKCLKWNK